LTAAPATLASQQDSERQQLVPPSRDQQPARRRGTTPATPATPVDPPASCTYTVVSGDSLFDIGQRFNVTVEQLQALNPTIDDAELIFPDQELVVCEESRKRKL
jgi:LysM repeat protein